MQRHTSRQLALRLQKYQPSVILALFRAYGSSGVQSEAEIQTYKSLQTAGRSIIVIILANLGYVMTRREKK